MSSIIDLFEKFKGNFKNQDEIFNGYSQIFRKFWEMSILNDEVSILDDSEIDPIIRFIDTNGKGNTKNDIALAKAGIRQGQWYRAFRSIKTNKKIKLSICKLFESRNDNELIKCLNDFEILNKEEKNGLTSKKAIILNGLMCLYNPNDYVSGLSLDHRIKMVNYLCNIDISNETYGERIIKSNRMILDYFKNKNILTSPRTISCFLYSLKHIWDSASGKTGEEETEDETIDNEEQLFILEKYFEDFLVGNWETTDLGKKYNLIYSEENELLSQQYKTDIGRIDLLVKEKIQITMLL